MTYTNAQNLRSLGGDDDKVAQLSLFLQGKSVKELRSYCYKVEAYVDAKWNIDLVGGLDDLLNSLQKEGLIKFIVNYAIKNKELLDIDRLLWVVSNYSQMVFLSEEPRVGGLHDYIYRTDREVLVTWAFAAERFDQEKTGMFLIGGLHDRINGMSNIEIADYILRKAEKYPELDSASKLNELAAGYGLSKPIQNFTEPQGPKIGGLHDYIFRQGRETLVKWALSAENYHRRVKNIKVLGGLEDYIERLPNDKVIEYILNEVDEHPEIDSFEKLNELSTEQPIGQDVDGGIHDYIFREPRETLIKWAIATEKYHRRVLNLNIMGGLHDYIDRLENEKIVEYILAEVSEHPELNNADKLNEISNEGETLEGKRSPIIGGLHDYINNESMETLKSWALTTEKYHRDTLNVHPMGGLHDYIDSLTQPEIVGYILREADEHPELNSRDKLNNLAKEFGF